MTNKLADQFREASKDFFERPSPPHLERALDILRKSTGFYRYLIFWSGLLPLGTDFNEGKAIPPSAAWHCAKDLARTCSMVMGLHEATQQKLREQGNVHILEAGSGPLAPATFMVASQFPANAVQFTLMDCHRLSCEVAMTAASRLGLEAHCRYIRRVNLLDEDIDLEKPDIVLLEALDAGLVREPQLHIERNLIPKTKPGTIFLPEAIEVVAQVAKREYLGEPKLFRECTLSPTIRLSSPMNWNWRQRDLIRRGELDPDLFRVKRNYPGIPWEEGRVYVSSRLTFFGPHALRREEDSALTTWEEIPDLIKGPNRPFSIDYLAGSGWPRVVQ